MQYIISLFIFIIIVLVMEYRKLYKTNKINYSNYRNCLFALSEYDKDLYNYLESLDK